MTAMALSVGIASFAQTEIGTWKGFRQSAATFTFDDGCANQLSLAVPVFDKYGYKASFYPVTGWGPNWSALRDLVSKGYEVGSHSDSHGQTMGDGEISSSKKTIDNNITNQVCNTITYPNCNEPSESELMKYYIGGRICDNNVEGKTPGNYYRIGSILCGSNYNCKSTGDFQGQMQQAQGKNGWVVFLLHEVESGNGHSPTALSSIEGALKYAYDNDSKIWVCTFRDAILYSKERNAAKISENNSGNEIILTITDNLDDKTYNLPLSLRREIPDGWSEVVVSQNGEEIESKTEGNYIYFEAAPDAGEVTLSSGGAITPDPTFTITSPAQKETWCSDHDTTVTISWEMSGEATQTYTLNWNSGSASSSTETLSVSSAEASSEWTNEEGTFSWSVDNILSDDGSHGESSRWGAQTNENEWVELTLSKATTVGGVILDEFEEYGTVSSFAIEYDDNGQWKTAYEGTTIGNDFKASFDPISTSKVRLFIKAASGVNINYFALTGISNVKIADVTGSGKTDWKIPSGLVGAGFFSINKSSKILVQSPSITLMKCDAADPGEDPQDPGTSNACDEYPSLSGTGTSISGNKIQNIGSKGFNVEQWYQNGTNSMTAYPDKDCAFKASWSNPSDYLARVGYMWGQNSGKTYKNLDGDIHAEFNFTMSGSGGGYSYIGIYGWTVATMVEYYIVENSFAYGQGGMYYGASQVGTYTVDGDTYILYKGTRTNAPNITGTNQDFPQIFAARGDGRGGNKRTCGHINVSEHFRQWAILGVKEIETGQLYDCKLLCEAGGGTGTFEMKYGTMWIGEKTGNEEIPSNTENGFFLAPNPASNNFSVISDKEIVKVEVINMVGQILLSQESTSNININVPAGMYFVKAFAADGSTYVEKLQVK